MDIGGGNADFDRAEMNGIARGVLSLKTEQTRMTEYNQLRRDSLIFPCSQNSRFVQSTAIPRQELISPGTGTDAVKNSLYFPW